MSRFAFTLAVAGAVALGGGAAAAPEVGHFQPDGLPLGTLYVGGVAEASFVIYAGPDDPNPKVKIDAPKFVKVLKTEPFPWKVGNNTFTGVAVEVAIDTAAAGEFKGEIVATVGTAVTKVPVSATVKLRKPGTPRVLVAGTPFDRFSSDDAKVYKAWTDLVDAAGLDVSYLLVRQNQDVLRDLDLSKFDCVFLDAGALTTFTAADTARARARARARPSAAPTLAVSLRETDLGA